MVLNSPDVHIPGSLGTPNTLTRSADDLRSGRHERVVNVNLPGGGTLPLASSTMSPEFMRDVQKEIDRLVNEHTTREQ